MLMLLDVYVVEMEENEEGNEEGGGGGGGGREAVCMCTGKWKTEIKGVEDAEMRKILQCCR